MLFRPCNQAAGADPAIRAAVERTLAACDIVRPPTPLASLLAYRKLTTAEQLDLTPNKLMRAVKKASARFWDRLKHKVAGILDLNERHISVNPSLHPRHREFLKFHEVGHDVLRWHRELFVVTSELDLTPAAREQFEAEANCFAGHAIFQNDHMASGHRGRRLPISELAGVAAQYDASLTATARQYLMVQDIPTALIVGEPDKREDGLGIRFRTALANDAFLREIGDRLLDNGFESTHPATAVLNVARGETCEVEVTVLDARGESRVLTADTLYNGYQTLTLLHVKTKPGAIFGWQPFRRGLAKSEKKKAN